MKRTTSRTMAIVMLLAISGTASAWYGDFDNRRSITIDNSGIVELDYYSGLVNLTDTPINETSLLIINETSGASVPHFCINVTSGNCSLLRFNCTHLPSHGTIFDTYYIYYNNASAISTSNGTNTFIMYDGFEGASIDNSIWNILITGVTTSTDQALTGAKSAKFVDGTIMVGNITNSANISVEYGLYASTTGDFQTLRSGDGTYAVNDYVWGADIEYYTTTWVDTGSDIYNNAWGVIGWRDFDWSAPSRDIVYDGTVIANNVGMRTYASRNNQISISCTTKTAYIDDFIVRKDYRSPTEESDWEVPGGYTCTGLAYDSTENCLWNGDFTNEYVIKIAKNGTKLGEINNININLIQGVGYDSSDDTLWLAGRTPNYIYHINKDGSYVGDNISVDVTPSGVTYKASTDMIWIVRGINLTRYNATTGEMLQNITLSNGADGLGYDASDDTLWYSRDFDNTIRHVHASNGTAIGSFSCPASYPEGVTIDSCDGTIWYADDSQFHGGVPNGNRIWHLTKAGVAKASGGEEPIFTVGDEESKPNDISIAANQHGMIRKNVVAAETFNTIASGIDHDRCYTWWDSTNDRWESYRVGYSYNAGKSVPQNDSYFVLMDGTGTTVSCSVAAAGTISIPSGWYATYLRESTSKTLSAIKTDMGGNVVDLYAFNSSAGAWTDTGTFSVLPNQGILVNASTGFDWDGGVP